MLSWDGHLSCNQCACKWAVTDDHITCFVFWGCIFGFCLLLGLKVFDYLFRFFDVLFLCFGLVVG